MTVELKPCPFCGGEGVLDKAYPGARRIVCSACGASVPWNCKNDIRGDEGEVYAAQQWNTRAALESKPAATHGDAEAAFQSALAKFGPPDDQFGAWHLDEGGLRTLVYDAIAAMPKAQPVLTDEEKAEAVEVMLCDWEPTRIIEGGIGELMEAALSALLETFEIRRKP